MEVLKENISVETPASQLVSAAVVSGEVDLPIDCAGVSNIVCSPVYLRQLSAEAQDGSIVLDGRVEFILVYVNDDGNLKALSAQAPFTHEVSAPLIQRDMNVEVDATATAATIERMPGNSAKLETVVEFDINATQSIMINCVSSLGAEDVQCQIGHYVLAERSKEVVTVSTLREDLELTGGYSDIQEILLPEGSVEIDSALYSDGQVNVSGTVKMRLLYATAEQDRKIQVMNVELPFSTLCDGEGLTQDMQIVCRPEIRDLFIKSHEDVAGHMRVLAVEAPIALHVWGWKQYEKMLVDDAYGLEGDVELERVLWEICGTPQNQDFQILVSGALSCQQDMPFNAHILYTSIQPKILSVDTGDDSIRIAGRGEVTVLFSQPETVNLSSVRGEFSFDREISLEGVDRTAQVQVSAQTAEGTVSRSGMGWEIQAQMSIAVHAMTNSPAGLITDATYAPIEKKEDGSSIILLIASQDDSAWSLAKQCRTTVQSLLECNPEYADREIRSGDKIVIVR